MSSLLCVVELLFNVVFAGRYQERLKKLEDELRERCTSDGAWVEPKGGAISPLEWDTTTVTVVGYFVLQFWLTKLLLKMFFCFCC